MWFNYQTRDGKEQWYVQDGLILGWWFWTVCGRYDYVKSSYRYPVSSFDDAVCLGPVSELHQLLHGFEQVSTTPKEGI